MRHELLECDPRRVPWRKVVVDGESCSPCGGANCPRRLTIGATVFQKPNLVTFPPKEVDDEVFVRSRPGSRTAPAHRVQRKSTGAGGSAKAPLHQQLQGGEEPHRTR